MMTADTKTAKKRLLPLFLAVVFVLLSLPQFALAAGFSAIVTASSMAVYSDPALSQQVGTLDEGEIVVVGKYKSGVAYISYPVTGNKGFVKATDLSKVSDVAKKAKVMVSDARFYKSASTSSVSVKLKKGTSVYVLATNGEWARVEKGGLAGYTYVNNLSIGTQTPTVAPTAAPTAAPTENLPSGFAKVDKEAAVVSGSMNVYERPDTDANKLGSLNQGTEVKVTYCSKDWAYITVSGKSGFAQLKYLLPDLPVSTGREAVFAKGKAPLCEVATTSARVLRTVSKGDELLLIAHNKTWAYVRTTDDVAGFMPLAALSRAGVTPTATAAPTATVAPTAAPTATPAAGGFDISGSGVTKKTISAITTAKVVIYKRATTSSTRQGMLAANTPVTVLAYNKDWAYITRGGKYGYCALSKLAVREEAEPTPAPTVAPTVTATATADPLSGFKKIKQTAVAVTGLTVYAEADTAGTKLGTLAAGTKVSVTACTADWAYINVDGRTGFAPLSGLLPDSSVTIEELSAVAVANTRLYRTAGTSAPAVAAVRRGDALTVLAYGSSWAYAKNADGATGYIKRSALKVCAEATATPAPSVTPSPTPVQGVPATVTAPSLIVYKSANTSAAKLALLKNGEEVIVIKNNSKWAYIEKNGNYGFVLLRGLTKTADITPAPSAEATATPDASSAKYTATVVYPNAPVYASASANAASVAVPAGTDVSVFLFNTDTGWAYVGIGDKRGYMLLKHLNKNSYSTLSSGSSGSVVQALQKALEEMGYFDGLPAGNYSALTEQAVSRFQAAVGISATGTADQTTLRILAGGYAPDSPLLSVSLTGGSTGSNVARLQTRLYYKGYLTKGSSIDGDYGSTTASAVKLFQAAAGIGVTGKADSATIRALYSNNAPKNSSAAPDAGGSSGGSSGGSGDVESTLSKLPNNPTTAQKIEYVIYVAQEQLGKPYVYGAVGPSKFDCSGLTTYCYRKVGVSMGRTAYAQGYNAGTKIGSLSDMKRGDIVCMDTVSDSDLCDHVGIYLGSGKMIHASSGSGKVVISSLTSGYYNRVFSWGRRVL